MGKPTHLGERMQPPVPRANEAAPVMNLVTSKNFVVANAVETILACPKKTSTTTKDYLRKEDYGKVPKYLNQIKSDINAEYQYIQDLQTQYDQAYGQQTSQLSEEERKGLIDGLKAKWELVNTEYQGGTHITKLDTTAKSIEKKSRKLNLPRLRRTSRNSTAKTSWLIIAPESVMHEILVQSPLAFLVIRCVFLSDVLRANLSLY